MTLSICLSQLILKLKSKLWNMTKVMAAVEFCGCSLLTRFTALSVWNPTILLLLFSAYLHEPLLCEWKTHIFVHIFHSSSEPQTKCLTHTTDNARNSNDLVFEVIFPTSAGPFTSLWKCGFIKVLRISPMKEIPVFEKASQRAHCFELKETQSTVGSWIYQPESVLNVHHNMANPIF